MDFALLPQLSHYPPLLLCLAEASSPVFSVSSTGLSNPQAEPTPVADRILLEYKGSDLQPRGAAGRATAAERQEREVVHHAVCITPARASSACQTIEPHLNDRWQNSAYPFLLQITSNKPFPWNTYIKPTKYFFYYISCSALASMLNSYIPSVSPTEFVLHNGNVCRRW